LRFKNTIFFIWNLVEVHFVTAFHYFWILSLDYNSSKNEAIDEICIAINDSKFISYNSSVHLDSNFRLL
jgi:hypothetical protein